MRALLPLLAVLPVLTGCSVLPESRGEAVQAPSNRPQVAVSREDSQCLARLNATGSVFSPLPDSYRAGGCATLGTVSLSSVQGDRASFTPTNLGPVACPVATAFAGWSRFGVDRAAREILGTELIAIETMGSYACRNVAGSSRLSAHATAEAIDVAAFVMADGRRIGVLDDWNGGSAAERRFLRVVHASACKRFGTVLGPDYNAAHRDHLHVEKTGGGYCR